MTIQEFAFQLSKKIQEQYSVKISRSHVYELIALNQGYKTYNAFVAQNLLLATRYKTRIDHYEHQYLDALTLDILKNPPIEDYLEENEDEIYWDTCDGGELLEKIKKIIVRLQSLLKIDLSEDEDDYLVMAKTIYRELLGLELNVLNFRNIRKKLSYIDFENGTVSNIEYDQLDFFKIEQNFNEILLYAKERNNPDAYAVLGGYYRYLANSLAPYGREGSTFGSRWDNKKQKYINTDETRKNKIKYEEYINQAEYFESYIRDFPISINEIDLYADHDVVHKQLLHLCNQGDLEAIEYFLYEELFNNLEEAWLYIYLAQMCGIDFTDDDLRAYNMYTGEEYDDYGPMAIGGREAIDLSSLDAKQDVLAKERATQLFENIK